MSRPARLFILQLNNKLCIKALSNLVFGNVENIQVRYRTNVESNQTNQRA